MRGTSGRFDVSANRVRNISTCHVRDRRPDDAVEKAHGGANAYFREHTARPNRRYGDALAVVGPRPARQPCEPRTSTRAPNVIPRGFGRVGLPALSNTQSSAPPRDASTATGASRPTSSAFRQSVAGPPMDPSTSVGPTPTVHQESCGDASPPTTSTGPTMWRPVATSRRNVGDRTARAGGRTTAARRGRQRPERRRGRGMPRPSCGPPCRRRRGHREDPGRGAEPGHARCLGTSADASMSKCLSLGSLAHKLYRSRSSSRPTPTKREGDRATTRKPRAAGSHLEHRLFG